MRSGSREVSLRRLTAWHLDRLLPPRAHSVHSNQFGDEQDDRTDGAINSLGAAPLPDPVIRSGIDGCPFLDIGRSGEYPLVDRTLSASQVIRRIVAGAGSPRVEVVKWKPGGPETRSRRRFRLVVTRGVRDQSKSAEQARDPMHDPLEDLAVDRDRTDTGNQVWEHDHACGAPWKET